ncbi:MAG: N-6 DNA methylase [Candidatus Aminicenantes bacterium]|jgi:type I restriction-modification system DNA methylase subunit
MIKETVNNYLSAVYHMFSSGDAREESYYTILESFILKIRDILKRPGLQVTIMPKKTEAGNPDLVIKHDGSGVVGYMEAKDPTKNLDDVENSLQIKRYTEVFPNFILTNFLEFRFYRYGKAKAVVSIARQDSFVKMGITPAAENEKKCWELFKEYLSYTFPHDLKARGLAQELAKRTRLMRDYVVMEELNPAAEAKKNKENYILGFYQAFKKYLIHDLSKKDFADLYSQTLTFGLFTAATRCKGKLKRELASKYIPSANGILHDVFAFISLGEVPQQLKCSMDDIVHVINSVNASKILNEYFWDGKGDDPVLHFYETFLSEYDPRLRGKRGVYYTPKAIVYFIVSSIHLILRDKLNRPDGLADSGIKILDPAAGTSTFLAEVAQLAINEYIKKYGEGTREDFAHHYLLNNLYGFEVMMAPYAVAYLKMAYILEKIGVQLKKGERFNIYLTNALEIEDIEQANLPGMSTLSGESRRAETIKKKTLLTVILGNPPYAGHALTKSETLISKTTRRKRIKHQKVKTWIGEQIEAYKRVDAKPLPEKNLKWLQDDYVKFIRFAQVKIHEKGEGVVGFVTNHAYLDNPTFRGMRQSLLKDFNEIYILNLHGNAMKKEKCPDGSTDENVFDIRQGVAISLLIKKKNAGTDCQVFYADIWGLRQDKYEQLGSNNINTIEWKRIFPTPEFYLFTPAAAQTPQTGTYMYRRFYKVTDIFPVHSVGIVTARDKLTIKESQEEVYRTVTNFSKLDETFARLSFNLGDDTRDWQVTEAQRDIRDSGVDRKNIVPILYRPFDIRYTYYTGKSRGFLCMPRPEVMRHMLQENIALITVRQVAEGVFTHCLAADTIVESRVTTSNKGIAYIFPLYIYLFPGKNKRGLFSHLLINESMPRKPNIHPNIFNSFREIAGFDPLPSPGQIFYYIYAVLFSPIYRETYVEQLRIDFPRVPFTSDYDLFNEVARLGQRMAALHLMKSPELECTFSKFPVSGDNLVKVPLFKPLPGEDGRVYINHRQYFSNIPLQIWEYEICGYPVMAKWLKQRKNKVLNCKDMEYYIKIARCLQLTIQYQQEIDRLYPLIEKSLIT